MTESTKPDRCEKSWQIHVENDCPIAWHDFDVASHRGNEHGAAALHIAVFVICADRNGAFDNGKDVEAVVVRKGAGRTKPPAVEREFVALNQAFDFWIACWRRRDGIHRPPGKISHAERLLNMKLARFSVAVDTVPIEEAIRGVAGLLNFGDQETGAQRVDRAGFDQDAVAGAWFELMKAIFASAAHQRLLERVTIYASFQTGINLASRLRGQDDPGFGFSEIGRIKFGRLPVVGVDLHRQRLMTVEEFQKQGKLVARMVTAEKCAAMLRHELVQRFAGEWSARDCALIGAMVHDFPALGVARSISDRLAEVDSEPTAAPHVLSQDRIESK